MIIQNDLDPSVFCYLVILESEQDRDLDQGDSCLLSPLDFQIMSWTSQMTDRHLHNLDHLNVLLDEVQSHEVLGAPGDDHVRVLLGRDAELLEGGLDEGGVLEQDVLQVAASLGNVPENASRTESHAQQVIYRQGDPKKICPCFYDNIY